MRIVCGSDFSSLAEQATTVAGLWSRRVGGDMHLVHAVRERSPALDKEMERDLLAKEAERLQSLGVALTAAEVVTGNPDEVLTGQVLNRAADMVVLGAIGHRLAERWLLGSVAARTARDSSVPVLVVRNARPFEQWLEGERPLRVVVGFERGDSAAEALRWAAALTGVGPIELRVLHLVLPGEENRKVHASGPGIGIALRPEAERQLVEELRLAVTPLVGAMPTHLAVQGALGPWPAPLSGHGCRSGLSSIRMRRSDLRFPDPSSRQRHGGAPWPLSWSAAVWAVEW